MSTDKPLQHEKLQLKVKTDASKIYLFYLKTFYRVVFVIFVRNKDVGFINFDYF